MGKHYKLFHMHLHLYIPVYISPLHFRLILVCYLILKFPLEWPSREIAHASPGLCSDFVTLFFCICVYVQGEWRRKEREKEYMHVIGKCESFLLILRDSLVTYPEI